MARSRQGGKPLGIGLRFLVSNKLCRRLFSSVSFVEAPGDLRQALSAGAGGLDQQSGNVFGGIARPSFDGVEGHDPNGVLKLASEKIIDDGLLIAMRLVSLAIGQSAAAEVIKDDVDRYISISRHQRWWGGKVTHTRHSKHGRDSTQAAPLCSVWVGPIDPSAPPLLDPVLAAALKSACASRVTVPPAGGSTMIVGNKAREMAELQAPSADAAIKRAIREFGITDLHKQQRLAARPVA